MEPLRKLQMYLFLTIFFAPTVLGQTKLTVFRELESDSIPITFLDHEFICSYQIYQAENQPKRIKYVQQVTNRSRFADQEIRWISAGLVLPRLPSGQMEPFINDIRFDTDLRPERFDASRDLGLNAIEIDTLSADGKVRSYAMVFPPFRKQGKSLFALCGNSVCNRDSTFLQHPSVFKFFRGLIPQRRMETLFRIHNFNEALNVF
jgi:hypothetical protein